MRGTLLNTGTVAGGALLGLAVGRFTPTAAQDTAISGLGLVTTGLAIRMFLQSRNPLAVAGAIALGGVIGLLLGFDTGLHRFADWSKGAAGGGGRFSEAVVTTTVLFCVGPMTLLGCLQDGLEGRSELLSLKSTMDAVAAFFFAAALGPGVLVTAIVVLVYQGALTLMARRLRPLAQREDLMAEISGAGGAILLATGLGLLGIKTLPTANYLPALVLAPLFALGLGRLELRKRSSP